MLLMPHANITINESRVDTHVIFIGSQGERRGVFGRRYDKRPNGLARGLIVSEVLHAAATTLTVAIVGAELPLEKHVTRDRSDKVRLFLSVLQVRCLVQDAGS